MIRFLLLCVALAPVPAYAIESEYDGHFKVIYTNVDSSDRAGESFGARQNNSDIDARLNANFFEDDISLVFNLANLTGNIEFDRAYIGYSQDSFAIKVGRQAISWGNGLAFHVMDFLNPFSPVATDKDYKPGDDMFYAQYLFDSGADLQFVAVARNNLLRNDVTEDASSFALKWRDQSHGFDYDVLLARHFDENVYALGVARTVFDAVVRMDVSVTDLDSGGNETSLVLNADYSWVAFGQNLYAFVEYFRNSFGVNESEYFLPDAELISRVSRGELFVLGKEYIATGFRLEMTPLINFVPAGIFNLHDESSLVQLGIDYELMQNLTLDIDGIIPVGSSGSEFGGIENPLSGQNIILPDSFFLRLSYFF